MAGNGNKISRKFEQAIGALLSEKTVDLAAAKVGITPRTLIAWMGRPDFRDAYRQARQAILERCVARLLSMTDKAADTLEKNLGCGQPAAENRAVEIALAHAIKGTEVLDLTGRIEELERRLQEAEHARDAAREDSPAGEGPAAANADGALASATSLAGPCQDPEPGGNPGRPLANGAAARIF